VGYAGPDALPKGAYDPDEGGLIYRRVLEIIVTDYEVRSWKSFWRVAVEGQWPTYAAQDMGITVNAVYLAKARVLGRLCEEFSDLLAE